MSSSSRGSQELDEFVEYGTIAAIATLNPLVEEALGAAYKRGASGKAERAFASYELQKLDLDLNGDGQSEKSLTLKQTTFPRNLDTITVGSTGRCVANYYIGIRNFTCDLNNDGATDMRIYMNRTRFGGLKDISVDTNGDGKPDHRLTRDKRSIRKIEGINVDLGDDGTIDGHVRFIRNGWGHIDKIVFEQPENKPLNANSVKRLD
ncbi:MAG: hypothetical protein Q8T09_19290 [Candidatus Melainabacteria bacterium]|nr:hypothetical protein [Candidatus Melainabacteria bacterium]